MKTKKLTPEEELVRCRILIKKLELQLSNATVRFNELRQSFKVGPKDRWYLSYLMKTNAQLGRLFDEQQDVISQYQEHYSKYGQFYKRFEEVIHRKETKPNEPMLE